MTHYHLVGIGGTGLSAIARVLFERGDTVSGSDMNRSQAAEKLQELGVRVILGHNRENIDGADIVIRSSAVQDANPEVAAALDAGIPVLKRRDFLGALTENKKVIAVAGTHGKTTTTAMIAWCLSRAGLEPSYVIGSSSKDLKTNAAAGKGDFFVIEADEYDHMFLGLKPDVLVVTNIEHDHPDCFPSEADYYDAFEKMAENIKPGGYLIACADDTGVQVLLPKVKDTVRIITYGESSASDLQISALEPKPMQGIRFTIKNTSPFLSLATPARLALQLPGTHNALNAAAAFAAMNIAQANPEAVKDALSTFSGTGRRFDVIGQAGGVTIIDDYGHHPTEIKATLSGARTLYPHQEIWAVWQPHTYSRTRELFDEFTHSFNDSDHVIVTEIYKSRECEQNYSSKLLVDTMPHTDKHFLPTLRDAEDFLKLNLSTGDVLIVFSAGDANQITRNVLRFLREKEEDHD